jgi:16S rRNA (adenine1518-N6/adenine1519-N6)-dimethyltransferase
VIAQSVAEVSILVNVPPEAFTPPPKVDSAVLLMKKTASRAPGAFEQMLKSAFAQPRKTLAKNLSARYGKEKVQAALSSCGYPPSIRPHQVSTADYHQLYSQLH